MCYSLSHFWLFTTPWTVACQALLSMGFSRQGYWSRLPFPSPGNGGMGPSWPKDQTWVSCIAGRFLTLWATRETHRHLIVIKSMYQRKYWVSEKQIILPKIGWSPSSLCLSVCLSVCLFLTHTPLGLKLDDVQLKGHAFNETAIVLISRFLYHNFFF